MHISDNSIKTVLAFAPKHPHTSALTEKQNINVLHRNSTELTLIKLLQQHRHTQGWIILIAPMLKPNKVFWETCQLPLNKILLVHHKVIKNVSTTISEAIGNQNCAVVINCAPLNEEELNVLTQQAQNTQCHFYNLHKVMNIAH